MTVCRQVPRAFVLLEGLALVLEHPRLIEAEVVVNQPAVHIENDGGLLLPKSVLVGNGLAAVGRRSARWPSCSLSRRRSPKRCGSTGRGSQDAFGLSG